MVKVTTNDNIELFYETYGNPEGAHKVCQADVAACYIVFVVVRMLYMY